MRRTCAIRNRSVRLGFVRLVTGRSPQVTQQPGDRVHYLNQGEAELQQDEADLQHEDGLRLSTGLAGVLAQRGHLSAGR